MRRMVDFDEKEFFSKEYTQGAFRCPKVIPLNNQFSNFVCHHLNVNEHMGII